MARVRYIRDNDFVCDTYTGEVARRPKIGKERKNGSSVYKNKLEKFKEDSKRIKKEVIIKKEIESRIEQRIREREEKQNQKEVKKSEINR